MSLRQGGDGTPKPVQWAMQRAYNGGQYPAAILEASGVVLPTTGESGNATPKADVVETDVPTGTIPAAAECASYDPGTLAVNAAFGNGEW
jgi:hypothetical protein